MLHKYRRQRVGSRQIIPVQINNNSIIDSVFLIQKNSLSHAFWKAFFLLRHLSQFAFQLDKHICSKLHYLPNGHAGWAQEPVVG